MNRTTKDEVKAQSLQLTQKNSLQLKSPDEIPEEINSINLHSKLIEKIKKTEINKKIPRLHSNIIYKIISYEKNTKYITCSKDKFIIIRNCEDNKIIRTLYHKEPVRDILLLSDGTLASSSQDNTIKIWNLTNYNCEQILIGHSDSVYCLLQLPNSKLLSGSQDSSIGIWDVSYWDSDSYYVDNNTNSIIPFYHQVKNDKQKQAYCMALIDSNKLAASSQNDINIYSFKDKSFNVIKTLKGHTNWIYNIKLMKYSKDLLVSCSSDKDCRLWSISQANCLKIFKGHTDTIWSMEILSEKIFVSGGVEMIFWNIESPEAIRSIKPYQSGDVIATLMENGQDELVFAGGDNFIGVIKI